MKLKREKKSLQLLQISKTQMKQMVDLHQPNLTSKETNIAKRMRNYARRYNLCFLELKFCPEQ